MPKDFQGDGLKHGERVVAAVGPGVLREGLIIGVRADGRIVVQFDVRESEIVIQPSGCFRIPANE